MKAIVRILLDRSGSMAGHEADVIGGDLPDDYRADPGAVRGVGSSSGPLTATTPPAWTPPN